MPALTSVSGFPRIGQNRELKKIIEAYWKGAASLDEVRGTAKELRAKHWKLQAQAGVDLIPSNDFSYYDQMLTPRSCSMSSRSVTSDSPSRTPRRRCSPWAAAIRATRAT